MAAVATQKGVMLKQIRILPDGTIARPDRRIRTTRDPLQGGPDYVQWVLLGGDTATYEIRFEGLAGSPFQEGKQRIPVPSSGSGALPVSQKPREYKYNVYREGTLTDDPDVIIE